MGTPREQTIVDAIETVFGTISIANGYKSDVTTVEQVIRDWQQVPGGLRPWLGINAGEDAGKPQSFEDVWMTMRVGIGGHVQGDTKALAVIATINLKDDVWAAMYSDPTFGDTAVDATYVSHRDDRADPDCAIGGASKGYGGTFYQFWDIEYERTTGSS